MAAHQASSPTITAVRIPRGSAAPKERRHHQDGEQDVMRARFFEWRIKQYRPRNEFGSVGTYVAEVFKDSATVNSALRTLVKIARDHASKPTDADSLSLYAPHTCRFPFFFSCLCLSYPVSVIQSEVKICPSTTARLNYEILRFSCQGMITKGKKGKAWVPTPVPRAPRARLPSLDAFCNVPA